MQEERASRVTIKFAEGTLDMARCDRSLITACGATLETALVEPITCSMISVFVTGQNAADLGVLSIREEEDIAVCAWDGFGYVCEK